MLVKSRTHRFKAEIDENVLSSSCYIVERVTHEMPLECVTHAGVEAW